MSRVVVSPDCDRNSKTFLFNGAGRGSRGHLLLSSAVIKHAMNYEALIKQKLSRPQVVPPGADNLSPRSARLTASRKGKVRGSPELSGYDLSTPCECSSSSCGLNHQSHLLERCQFGSLLPVWQLVTKEPAVDFVESSVVRGRTGKNLKESRHVHSSCKSLQDAARASR